MPKRLLLLAPALSSDQILEGAIIKAYVEQACRELYGDGAVTIAASWEQPALALLVSALAGRSLGDDAPGQQTVLLSIAAAATLASELQAAFMLVVCLNGPVPNPGLCAFAVLAASANRPVVYWKDDVRKLWGFEDDPLTLGLLPGASSRLLFGGPAGSLTQLARLSVDKRNVFTTLLRAAAAQPQGPPSKLPGAYTQHLVSIGEALQQTGGSYAALRAVLRDHAALLDPADRAFLGFTDHASSA